MNTKANNNPYPFTCNISEQSYQNFIPIDSTANMSLTFMGSVMGDPVFQIGTDGTITVYKHGKEPEIARMFWKLMGKEMKDQIKVLELLNRIASKNAKLRAIDGQYGYLLQERDYNAIREFLDTK